MSDREYGSCNQAANLALPDLLNDEGSPMNSNDANNWYCGRFLGKDVIPNSDGRCGPDGGPQCPSCRRFVENTNIGLRDWEVLRRFFPALALDDAPLVSALRRSGGNRIKASFSLITWGYKNIERTLALSARAPLSPPYVPPNKEQAIRVGKLAESLGVTMAMAKLTMGRHGYNADEAANWISNDREGAEEALKTLAEDMEKSRLEAKEWNERRGASIREAIGWERDFPPLTLAKKFEVELPSDTVDGHAISEALPRLLLPPVLAFNGHRLTRLVRCRDSTLFRCVLCTSKVPSKLGGSYWCEACLLCEKCCIPQPDSSRPGAVVHRCLAQLNGSHLHLHPLQFCVGLENHSCDVKGEGCLGTDITWHGCGVCDFSVCSVCAAHPVHPSPSGTVPKLNDEPIAGPLPDLLNDEDAPMNYGENDSCYCGRFLGTEVIPGSDGRCGPDNGPQCPSCRRFMEESIGRRDWEILRRVFPALARDGAPLVSALRRSGGNRPKASLSLIASGFKMVETTRALSARAPLPPPYVPPNEEQDERVGTLAESLGVTTATAQLAMRRNGYNVDQAADWILGDREGAEKELQSVAEEMEMSRIKTEDENVKREAIIREAIDWDRDFPPLTAEKQFKIELTESRADGLALSEALPPFLLPPLVPFSGHRLTRPAEGSDISPFRCVLCTSEVPSKLGGSYLCQACLLCERCCIPQPGSSHHATVIHRCPALANGGHLHLHPLKFSQSVENHSCDIKGEGCLGADTTWTCTVGCDFSVCRVCAARPAPFGYSRRLGRVIRPEEETVDDWGLGDFRDLFAIAGDNEPVGGSPIVEDENDGFEEGDELPLPTLRRPFDLVAAEREAAARWEGVVEASHREAGGFLLGTGAVNTARSAAARAPARQGDQEEQHVGRGSRRRVNLLPTTGKLSHEAANVLENFRSRSGESTVAAVDLTYVEDLLRRAQAVDARLTDKALGEAIAAGRIGIAGTLLLSQTYAPLPPHQEDAGETTATTSVDGREEETCWCGDVIDNSSSPDGAVGCLGGHAMHASCAADLLLGGGLCPTCRQPLFFSRLAGREARTAVNFAKEEIRRRRKEEEDRVKRSLEEAVARGMDIVFNVGDDVLVSPDTGLCACGQMEDPIAGGWDEDMCSACGLEGRVTDITVLDGKSVSVRVRSLGRHSYKLIKFVDNYVCRQCNNKGPSPETGRRCCAECGQCERCCRRTSTACPQTTHEWTWKPSLLTILRRSGNVGPECDDVFESEAAARAAAAERHITRLRGELVAVKAARQAVKNEADNFILHLGPEKIGRELSAGSSAAVRDMAASGVSPADWQRARHLMLLARQWGDSEDARAKRTTLYEAVRTGEIDSVARTVRRYNASRTAEAARWADAVSERTEYVVEPFAKVDLRSFPSHDAPKTGYSLEPGSRFFSKRAVLDKNGNVWLQVDVESTLLATVFPDDFNGKPVSGNSRLLIGSRVMRGVDWADGERDGGWGNEGVITQVLSLGVLVKWDSSDCERLYRTGEDGSHDLAYVGAPPPPPQGWLFLRPVGVGSPALVQRTTTSLRCFGCGERLVPAKFGREKFCKVDTSTVSKGDHVVVAATLEPVKVVSSEGGRICCSFSPTVDDGILKVSEDNEKEWSIWYRAEDLVVPKAGDAGDCDDETVFVGGRMRTRQEVFLFFGGDEFAARKAWREATQKTTPPHAKGGEDDVPFASCARGHLLHSRCLQGALLEGRHCPAPGCMEPLWVPSVTRTGNGDDDATCCGEGSDVDAESEALQAASELAGHAALVAARASEGIEMADREFSLAGLRELKMCPVCCFGPLFNENCSDMMTHHGECSIVALGGRGSDRDCTPSGKYRASASEIAASLTQISETRSVADVLPRCKTHNVLVMFNGCMSCGHLFTDTDWYDLPKWDPSAKALLELDVKKRNAARILAGQVRAEAALLQFERDALWEAGFQSGEKNSSCTNEDLGWSGKGIGTQIEPPNPPEAPQTNK